jgi:hypothetical protein
MSNVVRMAKVLVERGRTQVLAVAVAFVFFAVPEVHAGDAIPTLGGVTTIVASGSRTLDVVLPRDVVLDPNLFTPGPDLIRSSRAGSAFALVGLGAGPFPPTMVGLASPTGDGGIKHMIFPFGQGRNDDRVFDSRRLPAGRCRLHIVTNGPTTFRFSLPLPGATKTLRPVKRDPSSLQVLRADDSATGTILATQAATPGARNILVQTMVATLEAAPAGYESFWCLYRDGAPPLGYQRRCLGGSGVGVGNQTPAIDRSIDGFSAFTGPARDEAGRLTVSRSVETVGSVRDQISMFLSLPLDAPAPPSAAAQIRLVGADRDGGRQFS